jgi:hypothetical protein
MQQPLAGPAAPRLFRHARRALLLLGAAFVWWLLLTGGPAQADEAVDAPASSADVAAQVDQAQAAATSQEAVEHVTATTTAAVRDVPRQVSQTVAAATRAAPEPVRVAADNLTATLEPALTKTTGAVADTVDHTVTTVVRPVIDTVLQTAQTSTAQAPAPTVGRAPVTAPRAGIFRPHHRTAPTGVAQQHAVTDAAAPGDHALGAAPSHAPGMPVAPVPGAPAGVVSSGASSPSSGPLAALAGFVLVAPAVLPRRRSQGRADRGPDPAYSPGCSPD